MSTLTAPGTGPAPPEPSLLPARLLAVLAIVVALAAPFWYGSALALIGLRTPTIARLATTAGGVAAEAPQVAALERQIDAALAQLARSRADATQRKLNTWSSVYALTDLSAALRRAEPFTVQFAIARAVTGLPEDISKMLDQLAPYAAIGVPPAARITHDFTTRAARLGWSGPDSAPVAVVKNLLAWSEQQLSGSAPPVDDTRHRLAQASAELAAGDVAAAVDTVARLEGPAREAFSDWLQDATARAAADRLTRRVGVMLGTGRPAVAPPAAPPVRP